MKLHLPLSIAKYGKEEWCCFNYMYTSCKKESEINIFILGDYSHILKGLWIKNKQNGEKNPLKISQPSS